VLSGHRASFREFSLAEKDDTEGDATMAKPRMDLSAFVGKLLEEQDGDVLREGIRVLSQALMETEVSGVIGAERHQRPDDRTTYRNGYRTRTWDTRVGTIELAIPKLRQGTYFPSLLQPRRRAEHAVLGRAEEFHLTRGASFWDALILAACVDAGVETLYSEDLPGFDVEGLRVTNPFT
jgi:predicted nucleic acid-binding protein